MLISLHYPSVMGKNWQIVGIDLLAGLCFCFFFVTIKNPAVHSFIFSIALYCLPKHCSRSQMKLVVKWNCIPVPYIVFVMFTISYSLYPKFQHDWKCGGQRQLGCSDHEMVEFRILRGGRRVKSKLRVLTHGEQILTYFQAKLI